MPVVTTLHPVATKRAEVGTVRHRSPSSQNTALSFGKVQRFLLLSFVAVSVCLLCHTDTTDFYTIRLSGISPTSCYKTKNTPRSHAAITVVLAFAGLHSLKGIWVAVHFAASLSQKAVWFEMFFLWSSCQVKKELFLQVTSAFLQPGHFHCRTQSFGICEPRPVWHIPPDRNAPSSHTPANQKSLHVGLICSFSATPLLNPVHLFSGKGQDYYRR